MKTEKFDGEVGNFYNKPITELQLKEGATPITGPLKFEGEYEAFETLDEVRKANEYPKDSDIVTFINNKRKANARQKSMQAVVDAAGAIKPTLENDPQLRLKKMYDLLVANKMTEEEAKKTASLTLGIEWDE